MCSNVFGSENLHNRLLAIASEPTGQSAHRLILPHSQETIAAADDMAEESQTHNWTSEETAAVIAWRAANEALFTGRRNSSKNGWEVFVNKSDLAITAKQAMKKWNNLKEKYKGKGVEAGGVTAATWQWYSQMDAALQGQHSISPPLVVSANLTATTGGVVTSPSSAPPKERANPPPRKRARVSEAILDFMKEQAEREEEREQEAVARVEARERVASDRAERFFSLFERLVNKL
ncbi:unnamed protein product [Leuciscus chuanchicus]